MQQQSPITPGRLLSIPMRDGVLLRANLFLPSPCIASPALLFRTPYNKDEGDEDNELTFRLAVERGYALVVQDVRGRYHSDGEFSPYRNEGKDGYDTIEWISSQPWCNGNVGTFGLSYPGAVQWLAAMEDPPHLKAMVPAMSFSEMSRFIYQGGVFELEWISWAMKCVAPNARERQNLPGPRSDKDAEDDFTARNMELYRHLPLSTLSELQEVTPWYFEWLRTGPYDPAWDWGNLAGKYSRTKAAVLNLSGWHDEPYGPIGALANYVGLCDSRRDKPDGARTQLLIGPWCHGVASTGSTSSGDRSFGAAAAIDYHKVVLDFLDVHLRSASAPVAAPVQIFVMGENRWRDFPSWPPPGLQHVEYFLAGEGLLSNERPTVSGRVSFVSEPLSPVHDTWATNYGSYDLSSLCSLPCVTFFDTRPFVEDLLVVGELSAEIHLDITPLETPGPALVDCDLFCLPLLLAADGGAWNLFSPGQALVRASYRRKQREREYLLPSEPFSLRFERAVTANRLLRGQRLRLLLCSSWFPTYARNLQNGLSEHTNATTSPVRITIWHGGDAPSRLILPVAQESRS